MKPIKPAEYRYIKLGRGGNWAKPSFERGEVHFGYRTVPHELCSRGDWEAVTEIFVEGGRNRAKARDAGNQNEGLPH